MDFNLSKEQELLRDGLGKFLNTRYDLRRAARRRNSGGGWQPTSGVASPRARDPGRHAAGVRRWNGRGAVELMVIAEELGRALVIEPFVGTVVVAGGLLQRAGGAVAEAALERIAAARPWWPWPTPTPGNWRAARDGDAWVLNGAKVVVPDAPLATHLLITAATEGAAPQRIALFLTEFDPPPRPASLCTATGPSTTVAPRTSCCGICGCPPPRC